MAQDIFTYPVNSSRVRTWVRFKQINYRLDTELFDESASSRDFASNALRQRGFDGNQAKNIPIEIPGPSAYMYLPGAIEVGDGANYSSISLNFGGSFIENAIRNGALSANENPAERIEAALKFGAGGLRSAVAAAQDFSAGEAISPAIITKVLQYFNQEGTPMGAGIQSGLRMTANPHIRAIFQSVGLRQFNFNFELMPNSSEEAQEVERIIKFFRKSLYPSFARDDDIFPSRTGEDESQFREDASQANGLAGLVYNYPPSILVDMFYVMDRNIFSELENILSTQELDRLRTSGIILQDAQNDTDPILDNIFNGQILRIGPRLKPCHLTNVKTSWDNQSDYAWRPDGTPVSYSLSVSLEEDVTLSQIDVEAGY